MLGKKLKLYAFHLNAIALLHNHLHDATIARKLLRYAHLRAFTRLHFNTMNRCTKRNILQW